MISGLLEGDFNEALRLAQTTTDPGLKRAYAATCRRLHREICGLERDIQIDWIARLKKWNQLRPERHWKLVELDRRNNDVLCYHFSSRDDESTIRSSRCEDGRTEIILLERSGEALPDLLVEETDEAHQYEGSAKQFTLQWSITAMNPKTRETRTHKIEGESLLDAWEKVKALGFYTHCRARAEHINREFVEPWSTFRVIGINPKTGRHKHFETHAKNFDDAVRRFRHRGIKVVEWLFEYQ